MGFRVNKRIKLCKGVTLNVGKKGISTSVKVGNTTINSKGRVTTRIAPGVSYTTNLNTNKNKATKANNNQAQNNTYIAPTREPVERSKSISIILCCLGFIGLGGFHKFYEKKYVIGVIYLITMGLFFIGTIIDLIALIGKPSKYYI